MAKYFPYVTLDPQCCGLATVSGIGLDSEAYQSLADSYYARGTELEYGSAYTAHTKAVVEAFDKLMQDFQDASGQFKATHTTYTCKARSALTCSVTEFQYSHFRDMFDRWGWKEIAKFRNRKSGNWVRILFLSRDDEIQPDVDDD